MTNSAFIISPRTRVGELLDKLPGLEPVLMAMSPAFEKLKNPILRRTIARVATLQQVAAVGGLNVDELVNRLRNAAGQGEEAVESTDGEYLSAQAPSWFDTSRIRLKFNATPVINSGGSPMNEILHQTSLLEPGEIFELQTPFIPAPIIDMLKSKKFNIYVIKTGEYILSYICK